MNRAERSSWSRKQGKPGKFMNTTDQRDVLNCIVQIILKSNNEKNNMLQERTKEGRSEKESTL